MNGRGTVVSCGSGQLVARHWGARGRPAVVLLHGFLTSSRTWRSVAPALASGGLHVVTLDLPGSGDAPSLPGARWDAARVAALVSEAIVLLDLDRVTLVGTQMGGSIAAWVASTRPDWLERLVVIAAGAMGETTRNLSLFRVLAHPWFGRFLCRVFPAGAFRKKWLAAHGPSFAPDEAAFHEQLSEFRRSASAQAALAIGVRESYGTHFNVLPPLLVGVATPTLLVWGAEDRVVPISAAHRFADALVNSTLLTIPGCGDFPQEEEPEVLARAISAFCSADVCSRPRENHAV